MVMVVWIGTLGYFLPLLAECLSLAGPTSSLSTKSAATGATAATPDPDRTIRALYAGPPGRYPEYSSSLETAFADAGLAVSLSNDPADDPASYDYLIYSPRGPVADFSPFSGARAVLCLRAGVEWVSSDPTLPESLPVARMVDPGLRAGMVEYVTGHALRYHLRADDMWRSKERGEWGLGGGGEGATLPLAHQRTVGILGLGELGGACADALRALNFRVLGWSRTERHRSGVECFHGREGLDPVLAASDVLVLLLPDTPETVDLINRDTLGRCKPGVAVINAGRGTLIDDEALLEALDSGLVSGATLDVFRTEPLPSEHRYWGHPRVLITPHVAAKTRAETAGRVIAENIRRAECGEGLLFVVNRKAGY